jgi:hypothetical protein
MIRRLFFAAILSAMAVLPANAASIVGSKAISDIGATSTDTGNILTATSFTFGTPVAASGGDGDFATYASGLYFLTATTLDLTNISSFLVGNAALGTFAGTSYVVDAVGATSKSFIISGNFHPGTDFPAGLRGLTPASLSISFTQNNGPGTTISVSGTLSTAAVPEPASLAMAGIPALLGLGALARRLRRA